eukprot:scaffold45512_cov31-Tisochrysis_lutea.AAC.4
MRIGVWKAAALLEILKNTHRESRPSRWSSGVFFKGISSVLGQGRPSSEHYSGAIERSGLTLETLGGRGRTNRLRPETGGGLELELDVTINDRELACRLQLLKLEIQRQWQWQWQWRWQRQNDGECGERAMNK